MDIKKFKAERQWIRNQLSNVADFWLKNAWDHEHGGVTTCLDGKTGCRGVYAAPFPVRRQRRHDRRSGIL